MSASGRHYPVSDDDAAPCVCGWEPPAQEGWRQRMRMNEHLRDRRLGVGYPAPQEGQP